MRKINWGKIGRIIALIPVGTATVLGTIYMTNTGKPISYLPLLSFKERPELEEELIKPQTEPPKLKGGGGGTSPSSSSQGTSDEPESNKGQTEEEGSGEEDPSEESEETKSPETTNDSSKETVEEKPKEETSESETSLEKGLSSTIGLVEPIIMLKRIITSINELNIQQIKGKIAELFNLINALKQGNNAALILQIEKARGENDTETLKQLTQTIHKYK